MGLAHPPGEPTEAVPTALLAGATLFSGILEIPMEEARPHSRFWMKAASLFLLGAALFSAAPGRPKDLQCSQPWICFLLSSALCLLSQSRAKRREARIKVAFLWGDYLGWERGQIYRLLGGLGIISEF